MAPLVETAFFEGCMGDGTIARMACRKEIPAALQKRLEEAKAALHTGEALSSSVERSAHAQAQLCRQQDVFVARGLASRDKTRRSGGYVEAKDVLAELQSRLDKARKG